MKPSVTNYSAREATRARYILWIEQGCRNAEQSSTKTFVPHEPSLREKRKNTYDMI